MSRRWSRSESAPLVAAETRRDLSSHRVCAVEHAGLVRQLCRQDRSVLPRWHQDDRGLENAHRGHHTVADPGAYAGVAAWHGREHWLAVVVPVAAAVHRDVLKAEELSPATFSQWALVESGYVQDQATGRRCIVRPATVASVMGMHVDVARKCRRVARKLGLQVVIRLGRMLTRAEREAVWKRGSRQRGLSTEAALTIPSPLRAAVNSATPPRGVVTPRKPPVDISNTHGLAADKTEAAPPPLRPKGSPTQHRARRVAHDLIKLLPWLATERPGRLAPAVQRFITGPHPWSARDITDALSDLQTRTGRGDIQADRIRTRPAVLLAFLLRQLDVDTDQPGSGMPAQPPQPCSRTDCDGHGWLQVDEGLVAKCPDCDPGIRNITPAPGEDLGIEEPLF